MSNNVSVGLCSLNRGKAVSRAVPRNRKYSLLALTTITLIFLFFCGSASAGGTITADSAEGVEAGTTVSVPVKITTDEPIYAVQIGIAVPDGAEISISKTGSTLKGSVIIGKEPVNGVLKMVWYSTNKPITDAATLFTVSVTPETAGAEIPVNVIVEQICSDDDNSLASSYRVTDGTVSAASSGYSSPETTATTTATVTATATNTAENTATATATATSTATVTITPSATATATTTATVTITPFATPAASNTPSIEVTPQASAISTVTVPTPSAAPTKTPLGVSAIIAGLTGAAIFALHRKKVGEI